MDNGKFSKLAGGILKKIPYKSTLFWLCLGFAMLYLYLGWQMTDTLVYDYDGLLFHTDTAEVAEDITEFQTRNHGDTNVHPLFVLFTNPLGALLGSFLPVTVAIVLLNTLFGTLSIWLAYRCFTEMGLPKYQSSLWTILAGSTASQLMFVSLPERHIFASFSITLMCLYCIRHPGKIRHFLIAGVVTLGVTVTNFIQCGILFYLSLFNRNDDNRNPTFKASVRKTVQFGLTTLLLAVALSMAQKKIWPDTRYFFLPEVYEEETDFMETPSSSEQFTDRFLELSAHMLVFNIAAPKTTIDTDGKFAPLTLGLESFHSYKAVGWMALSGWTLLLFLGLYLVFFRRHNKYFWFQIGSMICVFFNIGMHMLYGDDFFLYTVNWTFLLIAGVASAMVSANKSSAFKLTANTLMTFLVPAIIINNALFFADVSGYFRYGDSMKWHNQHDKRWEISKEMEMFLARKQIHTLFSGDKQKWLMYPWGMM